MQTELQIRNRRNARCVDTAICSFVLALTTLAPAAAGADVASATVEVLGSQKNYTLLFDEQSGQYQDVQVNEYTGAKLADPVEAIVQFGGTCEPGSTLAHSAIRLIPSNSPPPDAEHEWAGSTNYDHAMQHVGTTATQHFKLREACNAARQSRPANAQGIIEPFTLWQLETHQVEHVLTCSGGSSNQDSARAPLLVQVTCGKAPAPASAIGAQSIAGKFTVTGADIDVSPAQASGECPVDVTLAMTVESAGAGTAHFVVESSEGAVSTPFYVTTKRQGNRYVGTVNRTFSVPKPDTAPTGPRLTTGGFTPPSTAGPAEGPQVAAQPIPPGHHSGSFRVRVTSPNELASDWRQYNVQCQTAGVATGGGFTQPANPTRDVAMQQDDQRIAAPGADDASKVNAGKVPLRDYSYQAPSASDPQRGMQSGDATSPSPATRQLDPFPVKKKNDRAQPLAPPPGKAVPEQLPARTMPGKDGEEAEREQRKQR